MKTLIGAAGVVAAITAAIVGFVLWDESRTSRRLSAEAPAIGFVATPATWYDSGDERNVDGHTLTFSFVDADHRVRAKTMEQVTWYDEGREYKVCYDPANADDFRLYRSDHLCGS